MNSDVTGASYAPVSFSGTLGTRFVAHAAAVLDSRVVLTLDC